MKINIEPERDESGKHIPASVKVLRFIPENEQDKKELIAMVSRSINCMSDIPEWQQDLHDYLVEVPSPSNRC